MRIIQPLVDNPACFCTNTHIVTTERVICGSATISLPLPMLYNAQLQPKVTTAGNFDTYNSTIKKVSKRSQKVHLYNKTMHSLDSPKVTHKSAYATRVDILTPRHTPPNRDLKKTPLSNNAKENFTLIYYEHK